MQTATIYPITDPQGGAILAASVNLSFLGTDYAPSDYVSINGGDGNGILRIDSVDGNGGVTAFTIYLPGATYTVSPAVATTTLFGIGSGLKVDVTSVTVAHLGTEGCMRSYAYPGSVEWSTLRAGFNLAVQIGGGVGIAGPSYDHPNLWDGINREIMIFDTSAIPLGATITSVVLSLYVSLARTDLCDNMLHVVDAATDSDEVVQISDWNQLGNSDKATQLFSLFTPGQYNDIILSPSDVVKAGLTKLGFICESDQTNTPPAWAQGEASFLVWDAALYWPEVTSPKLTITYTSAPPVPTTPETIQRTMNSLTARWDPSAGATSYKVDLAFDDAFGDYVPGYQGLDVGNVTEYTFGPLASSTIYYWRVYAIGPTGISDPTVATGGLTVGWGQSGGTGAGAGGPGNPFSGGSGVGGHEGGGGAMTTDQLIGMCSNYRLYREEAIPFNPEEVYGCANFVQQELLDELNLLESVCNLKLVANQERYWFQPVQITGATNTTPIVLTAPNHSMHTGDTGIVAAALGTLSANGKWPTITVIDQNTLSLDGSVGNGAYISGGMLYHGLVAATSIKSMRKVASPFGSITYKSKEDVEVDRSAMQANANNTNVVNYYEIFDEPIMVGFQSPPGADLAVEATFYRRAIPAEDISATSDPIIPYQYGKALYLGTLYEMLDKSIREEAQKHSEHLKLQYEEEKKRIRLILVRRRAPRYEAAQRMRT